MILRARIWARVSEKKQDEEQQIAPCLRRIQFGDRGEPWAFDARSGIYRAHNVHGDDLDHPLRQAVFADAAAGDFEVLVVWELSRWTRGGILVLLRDRERLSKSGVRIVSVREDWADNELLLAIAAWQDKQKLAQVREGTQRAIDALKAQLAARGQFVSRKTGRIRTRLGRPDKFRPGWKDKATELHRTLHLNAGQIARALAADGFGEISRSRVRDFLKGAA